MSTKKNHLPETVAAIDLGSNSFHMIVARFEESGTLSIIDRLRENVRLGGGLDENGIIDQATQNRALARIFHRNAEFWGNISESVCTIRRKA